RRQEVARDWRHVSEASGASARRPPRQPIATESAHLSAAGTVLRTAGTVPTVRTRRRRLGTVGTVPAPPRRGLRGASAGLRCPAKGTPRALSLSHVLAELDLLDLRAADQVPDLVRVRDEVDLEARPDQRSV